MRVAIGSDHAGYELKEAVKAFLIEEHSEVVDVGTTANDPVDYSDFAVAVGAAVRGHRADRGIILCGSGVGASMAANRIPGIRAGLCHDTFPYPTRFRFLELHVISIPGGSYELALTISQNNFFFCENSTFDVTVKL